MKLHPKIQELKRRAAPINYRSISVNEFGEMVNTYAEDLGNGIVNGYGAQFQQPNSYRELFIKGAFAKSINDRGPRSNSSYQIKFLNQHSQGDALSLFETLGEDDYGLRFRTVPLDEKDIEASSAASVLRKLQRRTLNNFSIGFDYVWDKMEYDEVQDLIIMKEAALYEISVVSIPADIGAFALRSLDDLEDLYDEAEELISKLPRAMRGEARELFARYKSLVDLEPLEQRLKALPKVEEPVEKKGPNYEYLLQNIEKII